MTLRKWKPNGKQQDSPVLLPLKRRACEFLIKPGDDICVYRKDWLLRFLQSRAETFTPLVTFGSYVAVFVGIKAALTYWAGFLAMPGLRYAVAGDINRYPIFTLLLSRFVKTSAIPASTPPVFPYLRDYSELILMVLMAAEMVLIQRLWYDLSIGLRHLYTGRIINASVLNVSRYADLVHRYDRWFNLRAWKIISIILAVALVSTVYFSAAVYGIYSPLNASGASDWPHAAYDNWWSNPLSHRVLFSYAFAVGIFICYYMIRNNIVGLIGVLLCRSVFCSTAHKELPVLHLDPSNPDGLAGLGLVKEILLLAYLSVLNSLVSLCVIYCCYGLRRWLIPFYVLFLLFNPVFVFVPVMAIRRQVQRSKRYQIGVWHDEIRKSLDGSTSEPDWSEIRCRQDWIGTLRNMPNSLFAARSVLASCVVYYIPTVLFIDWIVKR